MRNRYVKFDIGPESLAGCRFFDGLDAAERARIVRHCEGRRYRRGAQVLDYGDQTRDVFFLLSGRVKAIVITNEPAGEDSHVVTSQELYSGEMFGELSAIDGKPRSTSIVAAEESRILRMTGLGFRETITRNAILNERTMLRVCALARYLCDRSIEARTRTIPQQIALEILRIVIARQQSGTRWVMDPAPTHQEIADHVGTSRPQVTRVITQLGKAELIVRERGGRRWVIADGAELLDRLSAWHASPEHARSCRQAA